MKMSSRDNELEHLYSMMVFAEYEVATYATNAYHSLASNMAAYKEQQGRSVSSLDGNQLHIAELFKLRAQNNLEHCKARLAQLMATRASTDSSWLCNADGYFTQATASSGITQVETHSNGASTSLDLTLGVSRTPLPNSEVIASTPMDLTVGASRTPLPNSDVIPSTSLDLTLGASRTLDRSYEQIPSTSSTSIDATLSSSRPSTSLTPTLGPKRKNHFAIPRSAKRPKNVTIDNKKSRSQVLDQTTVPINRCAMLFPAVTDRDRRHNRELCLFLPKYDSICISACNLFVASSDQNRDFC